MRFYIFFFFLFVLTGSIQAQNPPHLLDHPDKLALVEKTLMQMYNWEIPQAEANLQKFSQGFEKHPSVPFTKAMILYWKHAPFDLEGSYFLKHEKLLVEASSLAEAMLDTDEEDMEAIFFKMSARSLLMKYYADKGQTMKAVGEARGVYKLMKKGFDLKEEMIEFYFTTGIYNYYREYYPERYPVYKPFAWVFQSGDKELGLEQLEFSARNATFTRPESYNYLTYIYLNYENNEDKALSFAKELSRQFPKNMQFSVKYIETLIRTKRYTKAEQEVGKILNYHQKSFYPGTGHIFKGMIYDLHYNNREKAFEHYTKAEQQYVDKGVKIGFRRTYLYYGLSKYWAEKGEMEKAKEYYKKAKECDTRNYLKQVDKPFK